MRSCAHKVPTVTTLSYNLRSENEKVRKVEKVTKINARIASKSHAHLQTMEKTCAKFQKDRYKIVRGVALTKYPLSIHWGRKKTKFTQWKNPSRHDWKIVDWDVKPQHNQPTNKVENVIKNNLTIISKPHAHPHTIMKTPAKFQKDWYKTVRGVVLTRHPG